MVIDLEYRIGFSPFDVTTNLSYLLAEVSVIGDDTTDDTDDDTDDEIVPEVTGLPTQTPLRQTVARLLTRAPIWRWPSPNWPRTPGGTRSPTTRPRCDSR